MNLCMARTGDESDAYEDELAKLASEHAEALDALMILPAPSLAALGQKLRIFARHNLASGWWRGEEIAAILACDANRLLPWSDRTCRLLLAFPCADNGARMFVISSDKLPFANAFEPFESVQFMSYGAGFSGAPCDPETPSEMRSYINWQHSLPNGSPLGGDLIQTEISMTGMKQRRWSDYFETEAAAHGMPVRSLCGIDKAEAA